MLSPALPFDLAGELWTMKKFLKTKKTREAIAACPGLTTDGAGAIYLFTCESPLYKELNAKLRARDRAALKEGFFPYARLLFEAHQAMRSTKPRMVNRGVKADLVGADPEAYKAGEEVGRRALRLSRCGSIAGGRRRLLLIWL